MENILLSICICTLPERKKSLEKLIYELTRQIKAVNSDYSFQIITDDTPKGKLNIGPKREKLKRAALGKYILFIDDDDFISADYIMLLLEAMKSDADIITFNLRKFIDGKFHSTLIVNRFMGCDLWDTKWIYEKNETNTFLVDQLFYHLCAVKKELADQVTFIDANVAEDKFYSDALIPLIKTEHHIDKEIYYYYYNEAEKMKEYHEKNKGT